MAGSMKALVKAAAQRGFALADVPVPELGPTDVLIAVEKAGVCGTDLHIYNWDAWAQSASNHRWSSGTSSWVRSPRSATPCAACTSATA